MAGLARRLPRCLQLSLATVFILNRLLCNPECYSLFKKHYYNFETLLEQHSLTCSMTLPSVIFFKFLRTAPSTEEKTSESVRWMQLPTGHCEFGFFGGS